MSIDIKEVKESKVRRAVLKYKIGRWLYSLYHLSKYIGFKSAIKYKLGGERDKNRNSNKSVN